MTDDPKEIKVFEDSVKLWKDLMNLRKLLTKSDASVESIDRLIELAFFPESHAKIMVAIKKANVMMGLGVQMKEWGIDSTNIVRAIPLVFDPGNDTVYARDIARWQTLKEMREELTAFRMKTKSIDSQLLHLFQVSNNACSVLISL